MGSGKGGGFRMGGMGVPVADSFRCLAELIQYCKFKNKIKLNKQTNKQTKKNKVYTIKRPEVGKPTHFLTHKRHHDSDALLLFLLPILALCCIFGLDFYTASPLPILIIPTHISNAQLLLYYSPA